MASGGAAEGDVANIDFSGIDELDPSTADGFKCVYDREVPFELRVQETAGGPQHMGTLEAIKVKVLTLGDAAGPQAVRVELSSEADLFFHFMHVSDDPAYQAMQEQQKLMVDFPDYPNMLIRLLNHCIKEPHAHLAVLVMHHDASARLDFIQNMEYKFVELMSLQFSRSPEDVVQHQITYRYNAMKSRLALMHARLQDINNLVKLKNPSLLLQLQRSATFGGAGA
ncbi:unnamed protein product [Phaeothamnion confervicola]